MGQPNYNRFPGMGDLPGDSTNPNSPDYVEPAFGMDDAAGYVARRLNEADEASELVSDVASARALFQWIATDPGVPAHHKARARILLTHAVNLDKAVDAAYALLNADEAA